MYDEENIILEVQGLNKRLKDFMIEDISFHIPAGYIMGFIGRNGAGKTTIMKLIQNVIVKDGGIVKVCGYDNRRQEVKAKNEIGFIVEHSPFMKRYTLIENGELFGKYYRDFDIDRFRSYLYRFKLDPSKTVISLSKGMESRFQLAFALAHKPRLLIMDEPTDGLDPIFRREFLQLLQELVAEEKMGVLFSTHITGDLDKVADYITLVDQGRIVLSQDKETLLEQYLILRGDKALLERIPKDHFIAVRRHAHGFEAMTEKYERIKPYINLTDNLVVQRATLDDIMYYYSKRGKDDGQTQGI
ncbi:MAG: transporter related protein [Herbinix sp.]|jgi:ABC-2 type transport system ATP-binding protein|nr:transporter related protein [Herbinix sp.]